MSWHIVPVYFSGPYMTMEDILPGPPAWLTDNSGEVYKWDNSDLYYPFEQGGLPGGTEWDLDNAYYINMPEIDADLAQNGWQCANVALMPCTTTVTMQTSPAWNDQPHQPTTSPYANHWFFIGYSAPGYCKLASIPNELPPNQLTDDGNPALFSYEGPFHNLIWDPANNYELYELKVVKDDRGNAYIPDANPNQHNRNPIDEIGVLEPGKGYFLGFAHSGTYEFEGWHDWPQWQNNPNSVDPDPKSEQNEIASAVHFQYNKYTHWSYPVVIDTIDQEECPMAVGDEVGVFDGDMCVGAAAYDGKFPMMISCWEDDKATPMEVDGYTDGNTMIFKWYDASENSESEFYLPPTTASKEEDNRVAPEHAGFGYGLYARRSLSDGIAAVSYLPKEFTVGQNYPNPFNGETIIPLTLPQRSNVTVDIFDISGRKVWTVAAGTHSAGHPKVHFNAYKLSSGVYLYRVTAKGLERGGSYQSVGKMLLLK